MDDYPGNSHRERENRLEPPKQEPRRVEKVVEGAVIRRKRGLGKRFSEVFLGSDAKSVVVYLVMDVLIPAAKDTISDMASQGVERMLFGESRSGSRRSGGYSAGPGGYVSYNRYATSSPPAPRGMDSRRPLSPRGRSQHEFDEIVFRTRVEAEDVLDKLFDIIGRYQFATVADFYEMVGEAKTPVDAKWGWNDLRGARVQKLRDGYCLDLPRPEHFD